MPYPIVEGLREALRPKGTADLVHLRLRNRGLVQGALVREALDEMERAMTRALSGNPANALERLAVLLLTESADITGEYAGPGKGLRLDVNGVVICDSLTTKEDSCPAAS